MRGYRSEAQAAGAVHTRPNDSRNTNPEPQRTRNGSSELSVIADPRSRDLLEPPADSPAPQGGCHATAIQRHRQHAEFGTPACERRGNRTSLRHEQ